MIHFDNRLELFSQFISNFSMKKTKPIAKKGNKHVQIKQQNSLVKDIQIAFDEFTQLYQDIDLSECISESGHLQIKKLAKLLEKNYNLSFLNKELRYYLEEGGVWLLCPRLKMVVHSEDYLPQKIIKISAKISKEYIQAIMQQSQSQEESENPSDEDEIEQQEKGLKCRRLKQRKIKHVIEKVLKWRQLYAGSTGKEKVPLQQGARIVGISKKTLDDYLSQIKKGKKYGFNFNQHKNEKIGVLREFIRKAQKAKK